MDPSIQLQPPPTLTNDLIPGPPDFIGIGAQRCGTTWWHGLLNLHPAIYNSSHLRGKVQPRYLIKERHFFDRFFQPEFREQHVEEYHHWCASPKGMISGEWTPRYLVSQWAPPLVKRCAPQAKLLVMLRDPIERFVSGMNFGPRQLTADLAHEHFVRGLYWQQLKNWLDYFDRSQILVLQYEKCRVMPQEELQRTFEFLQLEPTSHSHESIELVVNATRKQRFTLTQTHWEALIANYTDDVAKLVAEFPDIDRSLWQNFRACD